MYSTRLLILIVANTFSYMFYYHSVPFLVYDDSEVPNATASFGLIIKYEKYQPRIKNSFYYQIAFGALIFCCFSDILGRKVVLGVNIVLNIVFNVFATISLSPKTLVAVHIGMGFNFVSGLVQGYLLLCESIPKEKKRFMTGVLFANWGFSLFLSSLLYKLEIHWKIIGLIPLFLSFIVYLSLPKYFESPVYLLSVEDLETSETVMSQICSNEKNEIPPKALKQAFKDFKNYCNYFKDFGSNKRFLVILWFNTALLYFSLRNTRIKYVKNTFSNSMIAGLLLCSVLGFTTFNRKLDFWKVFLGSVILSRVSIFLLFFIEDNNLLAKTLYAVACIGLLNEVYSVFFVTEELVKGRIKSKVFGVLIFIALFLSYQIKSALFEHSPSRSQCLLCSLAAISSVVPVIYLKNAQVKSSMVSLIPQKIGNYEMEPII